jgi:hypothetical protein
MHSTLDRVVAEPRVHPTDRIVGIVGIGAEAAGTRAGAVGTAILTSLGSRILAWVAGVLAVSTFGVVTAPAGLTLPGLTTGLGEVGDRLAASAVRWDASWYLLIARHGYQTGGGGTSPRDAFFPLYPLLVGTLGQLGLPLLIAGIVISTLSLGLALYWLQVLVELEGMSFVRWRHPDAARLAVLLLALCPMLVFFSAAYSDSLFLALTIGAFVHARRGRWAAAGALGALAAACRPTGVLLILPLALLYLYGPRTDEIPLARSGSRWSLAPRYRIRGDAGWIALVPAGLLAFMAYLGLQGVDPLAPFHIEQLWGHHMSGPIAGFWDGARSAFRDLGRLLGGHHHLTLFGTDPGRSVDTGWQNLMPFALLLIAVPALVGVARTLPIAYAAYTLAALLVALAAPVQARPLQSVPRYEAVLFPLFMWAGLALARHPRWRLPVLASSALLGALFAAEFATWHFVA